jgi:hypothetical protein
MKAVNTKSKLIVLDTDVRTLRRISRAASDRFEVIPTRDARWACAFLAEYHDVAALIVVQRDERIDATATLRRAGRIRPDVRRLLLNHESGERATTHLVKASARGGEFDVVRDGAGAIDELVALAAECDAPRRVCA